MNAYRPAIIKYTYKIVGFILALLYTIAFLFIPCFNVHAEGETTTHATMEYAQPNSDSTLRKGSQGDEVRWLQSALNILTDANLTVNGDFGENTEKAIRTFQTNNNLNETGYADADTINLISALLSSDETTAISTITSTEKSLKTTEPFTIENIKWIIIGILAFALIFHIAASKKRNIEQQIPEKRNVRQSNGRIMDTKDNRSTNTFPEKSKKPVASQSISTQTSVAIESKSNSQSISKGNVLHISSQSNSGTIDDYETRQEICNILTELEKTGKREEVLDRIFSKLDIPTVQIVLDIDETKDKNTPSDNTLQNCKSGNEMNLSFNDDMSSEELIHVYNTLCRLSYEKSVIKSKNVPHGMSETTEGIAMFLRQTRLAYDFVRASTICIIFSIGEEEYYGCRSLLESAEEYAALMCCLTAGFNLEWMNKLDLTREDFPEVYNGMEWEDYVDIWKAPLHDDRISQMIEKMPKKYTILRIRKATEAALALAASLGIDSDNIIVSTIDMINKRNKDGTAYTFSKKPL